jgi:DNA-binding CsgD family transcriptional regulator
MSVIQAESREGFRSEIVRFTQELGFERVSAVTVVDHPATDTEFISIDNTPPAYMESFMDREKNRRDPVTQHCKHQGVPIVWDQGTYVDAAFGEQWESQAQHGYRTGISLALHLPEGRHFMLGVVRDVPLPTDRAQLTRLVADVQLFAVYAQEAAFRILVPPRARPETPGLTPRELEGLRWTMEGKTAWEVGAILGISERTAVLHINNAMHKLGCVNKHQAVLKALRLGLIH